MANSGGLLSVGFVAHPRSPKSDIPGMLAHTSSKSRFCPMKHKILHIYKQNLWFSLCLCNNNTGISPLQPRDMECTCGSQLTVITLITSRKN